MFVRDEAWTSLLFSTEWGKQEWAQLRTPLRIRTKNMHSDNADVFRRGRRIAKRDCLIPYICPSVRPHGPATLPLDGLSRNLIFETFLGKICRDTFQSNLTRIAETLYEDLCTCMKTPRWILLKMFHTKVEEKIKTHILCTITLFRKSCRLWDNVEKYCRAGQATWQWNTTHAHYMLDN